MPESQDNFFTKNFHLIAGYASIIGLIIALFPSIKSIINSFSDSETPADYSISLLVLTVLLICFGIINIALMRFNDSIKKELDLQKELNGSIRQNLDVELKNISKKLSDTQTLLDDSNSYLNESAQVIHNFSHEFRCISNRIYTTLLKNDHSNIQNCYSSFKSYLSFLLSNVKTLFDLTTNDSCSVCIKLIDEEKYIRTFYRDHNSYVNRSEIDLQHKRYPFYVNSAYKHILDPNQTNYYIENDINNNENYINLNTNRSQYYNATIVAPIQITSEKLPDATENVVLGFMCVDNKKGGFNEVHLNFLATISDSIFLLFRMIEDLSKMEKSKPVK